MLYIKEDIFQFNNIGTQDKHYLVPTTIHI